MDCDYALLTLTADADEGRTGGADYREAVEHCRTCPACAQMARGLVLLGDLPVPEAPEGLADRVVAAVTAERAAIRATAALDAVETPPRLDEDEPAPLTEDEIAAAFIAAQPPARLAPKWLPWAAFAAGVAATLLGVFIVARAGLTTLGNAGDAASDIPPPPQVATPGGSALGTQESAAPQDRSAAPASAPGFVVYKGRVWRAAEGAAADRSGLTTEGVVRTDLGGGIAGRRDVLASDAAPDSIVVVGENDALLRFTLVKRNFQGAVFALTSSREIAHFGEWPDLPSNIPNPASADGSPTFAGNGADDLGVTTYPLAGTDAASGFAIAPGTSIGDPAAGNPNWTWWEPLGD